MSINDTPPPQLLVRRVDAMDAPHTTVAVEHQQLAFTQSMGPRNAARTGTCPVRVGK
jgi:hypothetical protein